MAHIPKTSNTLSKVVRITVHVFVCGHWGIMRSWWTGLLHTGAGHLLCSAQQSTFAITAHRTRRYISARKFRWPKLTNDLHNAHCSTSAKYNFITKRITHTHTGTNSFIIYLCKYSKNAVCISFQCQDLNKTKNQSHSSQQPLLKQQDSKNVQWLSWSLIYKNLNTSPCTADCSLAVFSNMYKRNT